jgi:FtsP/CotA-like multicopper oxidase with cupredoxin domain
MCCGKAAIVCDPLSGWFEPSEHRHARQSADNPGLTLFHCHQQLHMDFGFMALFKYV